ncbi:MAG: hypothetical protein J6Y35_04620 [Bacteroidales bacterium]|nr:hypothetical protein [Bacteroidales bacterium]
MSYHSLFRGSICGILPFLPPVPRAGTQAIASPILRCHVVPPCKGLLKSHPSGVKAAGDSVTRYARDGMVTTKQLT